MQSGQLLQRAIRHPWPIFLAAFLLAVAGFWPSFFAVLPETSAPHLVHGFSATAWMALPLLQYALIRTRRRNIHRLVGWVSLALAAIVVASGVFVVQMMAYNNIANFRLLDVKFVWLDLTGMALFCVYVAVVVLAARKRDIRLHVTALAASALIPLEAALERLFVNALPWLVPNFSAGLYASLFFLEAVCLAIIFWEWRSGRIRWPMPVLFGYYLLMHVTMTPVASSEIFQNFTDWFAMIGRSGI
jgi:uncharacterized membrane protein